LKDSVEDARKEYFAALTGKSASLDAAFDLHKEKTAAPNSPSLLGGLQTAYNTVGDTVKAVGNNFVEGTNRTNTLLSTLGLLGALGAGGVGAKYMYDKTKDESRAESLRRAAVVEGTPEEHSAYAVDRP
jgi:hypothetical protein